MTVHPSCQPSRFCWKRSVAAAAAAPASTACARCHLYVVAFHICSSIRNLCVSFGYLLCPEHNCMPTLRL